MQHRNPGRARRRLAEPSTWAGLAAIAAAFGLGVPDTVIAAAPHIVSALAGLAAIFLPERGAS